MTGPLRLATSGAGQTRALAGALAPLVVPGDVLLLAGDLGAGKTTFAQGFGAGLGIGEPITSPTFTLVRQYPLDRSPACGDRDRGVRVFYHADVYRLDHLQEIADLGLGELVEDGGVALVEWGDVAAPLLGRGSLRVALSVPGADEDRRLLTVDAPDPAWLSRWEALATALRAWAVPE
ncbi:MAG TPA: tRNA (adenosine(37)-N6)-threonylcarbamoyltransferase complex ATPase subunit type 1 TsaE [Acidimicrobiales bacterium]